VDVRMPMVENGPEEAPGSVPGSVPGRDVPEWDDAFGWATGTEPWVPAVFGWGWHKDIEIKLTVLLDAGIPACLKARPWGDMQHWQFITGYERVMPVLVPASRSVEARDVLAAPFDDADGVFAGAAPELAALRRERTWAAQVPKWFAGYAFAYLAFFALQLIVGVFLSLLWV